MLERRGSRRRPELERARTDERFEHAIAHGAARLVVDVDERLPSIASRRSTTSLAVITSPSATTAWAGGQRQPSTKTLGRRSIDPLRVAEQVVAPGDRGLEGLVPRERGADSSAQQAERVVEPGADLVGRQVAAPRRSKLDGEGHAVEPSADLGDVDDAGVGKVKGERTRRARSTNSATASNRVNASIESVRTTRGGYSSNGPAMSLAGDATVARFVLSTRSCGHGDERLDDASHLVERCSAIEHRRVERGEPTGGGGATDVAGVVAEPRRAAGQTSAFDRVRSRRHTVDETVMTARTRDGQRRRPAASARRGTTVGVEQTIDGGDIINATTKLDRNEAGCSAWRMDDRRKRPSRGYLDLPDVLGSTYLRGWIP